MNNKHVGAGIKVKLLSHNFQLAAPRCGGAAFVQIQFTRSGPVVTGKLYYEDGGLIEFNAPLMPGEQDELNRLIESVAGRVERCLADRLRRDKDNRRRSKPRC